MPRGPIERWEGERKEPLFARITNKLHSGASIRERIAMAIYRLKVQQSKLDNAYSKMQRHGKDIFDKCVKAQMERDTLRAAMYANECAEIRKMAKITIQCQLALEQVSLRLETIQEFGDIAAMMVPVASVVRSVRNHVMGIVPEVGLELTEIGELLNGVVIEIGEATGQSYDLEASGEEAQRILNEASAIAEQRMKERFPELPAGIPATERTDQQSVPR